MKPDEGSGPIGVYPLGLLGFLNIKNVGQYPKVLPDTVQCTLDTFDWLMQTQSIWNYQQSQLARTSGQDGFALFTTNPISVPQNEWWFVENFTAYSALGAGDSISLAPMYQMQNALSFHRTGEADNAAGPDGACAAFAENFWLPPGAGLGIFVRGVTTAGSIQINGSIRYTPLPI